MTSTIKVNNVQNQCGANIINESSNTITIGASGDTVSLASGASQSGFGRSGSVDWQTGSIKTANFTAADGEGYFCNTSGGAFTVTLPSGSAGAIIAISDYTRTFNTNNLTISPQSGEKIGGVAADTILSVNGQALTLVYVDGTEGWINVQNAEDTETGKPPFIEATGGTITCCGDFKIHTFTGPGTFTVTNTATLPANNQLDYLVVAGGGGGGGYSGGGGGAGGFRVSNDTCMPAPQTSPLANPTGITASATSYPITVGGGGAAGPYPPGCGSPGVKGSDSVFSTITSTGGGLGMSFANPPGTGGPGGSGGGSAGDGPGSASYTTGGSGNTPPVSPAQGTDGGRGVHRGAVGNGGGGGGGASAAGSDSNNPSSPGGFTAGAGGAGSFVVSAGFAGCQGESGPVSGARYFAGGGGAGSSNGGSSASGGAGGVGGGGDGTSGNPSCGAATVGATNTGGGGAGAACAGSAPKKATTGGSGIVIIRYKFQ